jgi:hypothetical protein
MVFSVNTLECWRFKRKEWILLLCKACALVIGLKKNVGQLGFLFWFSVENDDNGVTSSEFLLRGFLPPVWVLVVVTPFRLGHCYDSFLQVAMQLLGVALFLLCLAEPRAIVCYGLYFTVTIVESVAQSNLCIAQNLEWKLVYVSSGHGLCSGILSTVFIRIRPLVIVGGG